MADIPVPATRYPGITITRQDFPKDFIFGCSTAAYQVEGAYDADGKSMNNWDAFTLRRPDKIADGTNGCVAIDQYNRYKEDVMLMKKLGLDAYRFSLNWSRILPGGRLSSGVNRDGVKYYNDLINFCLAQGIQPFVTIFHFDLPQCLEDEYGGFLSPKIVDDFCEFADLCFWEFGDRVKYWTTFNEPWSFTNNAYITGVYPPGRGANTSQLVESLNTGVVPCRSVRRKSTSVSSEGDAGTEPYIVAHHFLLAHAFAVDIYRKYYQEAQGGKIGMTNMSTWFEPLNEDDPDDVAAAQRAVDFMWGWFVSPLVHGDYPPVMRQLVGKRLPKFTAEQVKLVQGSYDFIGLNYYTCNYAANLPTPPNTRPTYYTDRQVFPTAERNGVPIGENPGSAWLYHVPRGIYGLLTHTRDEYNDPLIYITEQGMSDKNNPDLTVTEALKDPTRAKYFQDHLTYVKQAIDDGVKIKSYFLWSICDNFEWAEGYTARFGIFYVDFVNGLKRYRKLSALWWMNFLKMNPIGGTKRAFTASEENHQESAKRLRSGN